MSSSVIFLILTLMIGNLHKYSETTLVTRVTTSSVAAEQEEAFKPFVNQRERCYWYESKDCFDGCGDVWYFSLTLAKDSSQCWSWRCRWSSQGRTGHLASHGLRPGGFSSMWVSQQVVFFLLLLLFKPQSWLKPHRTGWPLLRHIPLVSVTVIHSAAADRPLSGSTGRVWPRLSMLFFHWTKPSTSSAKTDVASAASSPVLI